MKRIQLLIVLLSLLGIPQFTQTSHARTYIGFGIRLGVPYYGPGPYYGPYYYGYPYYYGPPPLVYQTPPPIVVQQPPPAVSEGVPSPSAPPVVRAVPPAPTVVPAQNVTAAPGDGLLQKLNDPSETVRRDAAMDLGRNKDQRAIDPLLKQLAKDTSPIARDAAARALGLIGAQRSLTALIYAAQADNDRDVRHSAQFAIEVIRTNLRDR